MSDALANETMNALEACTGLRVVPPAAVFALKRATNDLPQIGAQLGVHTVLAGTFLRNSNGMRLTARLLNVADGVQFWSDSFNRGRDELGMLGADVIQPAARALKLTLDDGLPMAHRALAMVEGKTAISVNAVG